MSNLVPESRVKHPIVERFLISKSTDGRSTAVRLQIGLPLPVDNDPGRWQAEVCLAGLYDSVVFAPGVDSFQCMLLSMELIKKALESAEQAGAQFFWRDGSGPVSVKGLFS